MDENLSVEELNKQFQEKKEQESKQNIIPSSVRNEIDEQYIKNKKEIVNSEDFKKLSKEITDRATKAEFAKDMLDILTEEQKNALATHLYECEIEKFNYRKKHEKKVILEDVKAELSKKKVEALKKKYGHLYPKDENGEIIGFVPSKAYNKYKAFVNWWENTSDGFKKITKGILRFLLWTAIIALVIIVGKAGFKWLTNFTKNLPQ